MRKRQASSESKRSRSRAREENKSASRTKEFMVPERVKSAVKLCAADAANKAAKTATAMKERWGERDRDAGVVEEIAGDGRGRPWHVGSVVRLGMDGRELPRGRSESGRTCMVCAELTSEGVESSLPHRAAGNQSA